MIIVNKNAVLKKYDNLIMSYARRISFGEADDHAQEIRIYLCEHIDRFDPTLSSLRYFINMIVTTAFRKIVYDRKKQVVFEDDHINVEIDMEFLDRHDNYDELVSGVVQKLKNEAKIAIFYSLLYSKGEKNFTDIAKHLNMNYQVFLNYMKDIRSVVKEVIKEAS